MGPDPCQSAAVGLASVDHLVDHNAHDGSTTVYSLFYALIYALLTRPNASAEYAVDFMAI